MTTEAQIVDPRGQKIIGIDLGTTYSCVAHIDEHRKPETILNDDATPSATTPSAVLVESDTSIIVGQLARDQAVASPENVITLAKREMGKGSKLTAGGKVFTPEEVSAMILKKLKQDAERKLGGEVRHAVITVPAYFGVAERKATQDAGEMAGFVVHQILNEPVAAALAYGFANPQKEQTLLVYDLGGGTFDVTLFKIRPNAAGGVLPDIEMISTGGNHDLGGANWDEIIMEYVAQQFIQQHFAAGPPESGESPDPRDDPASKQDLLIKCEKAKVALAKSTRPAKIACQHLGKTAVVELDEPTMRKLTQHLVDMTETEIDSLLAGAGHTEAQIDQVLLAGGSTRLKMVRDMLDRRFGAKVNPGLDPDQCVAQGAAWMGHLLSTAPAGASLTPSGAGGGDKTGASGGVARAPTGVKLVITHTFGVAALDDKNQVRVYPLVLKNAKMPCSEKDTFYAEKAGQTNVAIPVYENGAQSKDELLDCDASRKVGVVTISDLPAGRPAGMPIEVTFNFDEAYRFRVKAVDVTSGKTFEGELDIGSGLDDGKKEAMRKRLAATEVQS